MDLGIALRKKQLEARKARLARGEAAEKGKVWHLDEKVSGHSQNPNDGWRSRSATRCDCEQLSADLSRRDQLHAVTREGSRVCRLLDLHWKMITQALCNVPLGVSDAIGQSVDAA
jgi:hypothetical protein